VSHQPERKLKDCLNCGTIVHGRYCHKCGQENIETKETFWGLVHHFIEDVTHFDSKFFDTLKYILFRPGYLSTQYLLGKRASYLNPIRMYLFTSAVFFLIFSFQKPEELINIQGEDRNITSKDRQEFLNDFQKDLKEDPEDTVARQKIALLKDTTRPITFKEIFQDRIYYKSDGKNYSSIAEYDSIQNALPKEKRDGWLDKMAKRKGIEFNKKYKGNFREGLSDFLEALLHKLPYLLFISLPFLALILKLIYIRRKSYYYTDHIIFTLHHYIFSFILFLVVFGVGAFINWTGWEFLRFLIFLLFIWWCVYLFLAMKNFYRQGYIKTFFKFLLLNILGGLVILILFVIFLFFSIFQS